MQFLYPQFLWLLLLGIIPVMLYLFRRKSKKVRVSTLVFFKTLAKEHQESAWLRRLKKIVSFVLTILMLSFAVFVLSRLIAKQDDPDRYRTIVILLDRSASMGVADEGGNSLLDAGKDILRARLAKVPEEVGVSLIAYDVRPEVLQPRTLNRRELISRLEGVDLRPMADDRSSAVEAANLIAGLETPTAIWHASDRPLFSLGEEGEDSGLQLPEGITVKELTLAQPEVTNAGITAFQIRPVPLEYSRYEVYTQIALNSDAAEPVTSRLEVSVGGVPNQFREIDLEPGERVGITFRLDGVSEQLLHLHLKTEGDAFALDDDVTVSLPESRPILAAWIREDESEDPYTRFALSAVQESGRFELLMGGPDAWPLSEEVDAVIFDGWLPEEWPEDLPAIVINPPGPSGPVLARALPNPIPYDAVRVGSEEHPVLFRVGSSRVAVTQTAVFQSAGSLEPLWLVGQEPILAAGEVKGRRLVLMGFSPGQSERLPLTASFPLLIGNALLWIVDRDMESGGLHQHSTGDLVKIEGKEVSWKQWENGELKTRRVPFSSGVFELDRVGAWESDIGEKGSSHILSAVESSLPTAKNGEVTIPEYFQVEGGASGGLKLWLLSGLLVILLVEAWFFHRLAVY